MGFYIFEKSPTELLKYLLLPFAEIYALITDLRNWLYDKKYFKSARFQIPVISVGNLSVGGTGKSPHIEYLITFLQSRGIKVATLSRGYGRKTREYILANNQSTVDDIGDEPLVFKKKFPDAVVAVGIDRLQTIPRIIADNADVDVILLDDAFQHRAVRAGLSILLTDYSSIFIRDFVLPAGRLRERRKHYHRADIIIVTKCPDVLHEEERVRIIQEISPKHYQHVFFSGIAYGEIYGFFPELVQDHVMHWVNQEQGVYTLIPAPIQLKENCLLVSGIAKSEPLEQQLKARFKHVYHHSYSDHHRFDDHDVEVIKTALQDIGIEKAMLLTTEKDAMRLLPFKSWFIKNNIQIYIQPIAVKFLESDKILFESDIANFVDDTLSKYKAAFDNIYQP
jgi:tetraacyldisaccharide 4'-kinase